MFVGSVDIVGGQECAGEQHEEPQPYRCHVCGGWGFALPFGEAICLGCYQDRQLNTKMPHAAELAGVTA